MKCQDCKFVWANCTVYCSNKMLQRLAVTNPKNDKMDPHGVNPTLSIFLPTPFPVAMQGLGATAPWEKDLRIPCLEIIVFTNWKTGIGLSKECYLDTKMRQKTFNLSLLKVKNDDHRNYLPNICILYPYQLFNFIKLSRTLNLLKI